MSKKHLFDTIPASTDHLEQIHPVQQEDPTLSQLMKYCQEGWPARHHIKVSVKQYWCVRSKLCMHNELLWLADRIVIPTCLQQGIPSCIHQELSNVDSEAVHLFGGLAYLSK